MGILDRGKRAIERSFHLLTSDAKIALVSIGKEPLEMMDLLRFFVIEHSLAFNEREIYYRNIK